MIALIFRKLLQNIIYLNVRQKMEQINQSLFFSIAKQDFETAKKMLDAGANPNCIFQIEKGKFISSFNLFIQKTALVGQKKGHNNNLYISCMELMGQIIKKSTIQCKCLKEHKCPLYIALQTFKITTENQILEGKCDIIRYLIIHGATLKFDEKQNKKNDKIAKNWKLQWLDLEGIRSYLITKNFQYKQTKIE